MILISLREYVVRSKDVPVPVYGMLIRGGDLTDMPFN